MIYHNKDKKFALETKTAGNPFAKPVRYIPGYYDSSFNISSYVAGTTSDFTIVANADDLDNLDTWIGQYPAKGNSVDLFRRMGWNSPNELKIGTGLINQTLRTLQDKPLDWHIPENHFAVIHVQKNTQKKIPNCME